MICNGYTISPQCFSPESLVETFGMIYYTNSFVSFGRLDFNFLPSISLGMRRSRVRKKLANVSTRLEMFFRKQVDDAPGINGPCAVAWTRKRPHRELCFRQSCRLQRYILVACALIRKLSSCFWCHPITWRPRSTEKSMICRVCHAIGLLDREPQYSIPLVGTHLGHDGHEGV